MTTRFKFWTPKHQPVPLRPWRLSKLADVRQDQIMNYLCSYALSDGGILLSFSSSHFTLPTRRKDFSVQAADLLKDMELYKRPLTLLSLQVLPHEFTLHPESICLTCQVFAFRMSQGEKQIIWIRFLWLIWVGGIWIKFLKRGKSWPSWNPSGSHREGVWSGVDNMDMQKVDLLFAETKYPKESKARLQLSHSVKGTNETSHLSRPGGNTLNQLKQIYSFLAVIKPYQYVYEFT